MIADLDNLPNYPQKNPFRELSALEFQTLLDMVNKLNQKLQKD